MRNLRLAQSRLVVISTKRFKSNASSLKSKYDAIIVGAGHNGLISAAYLQKAGLNVLVLERRHIIGGAAVTEEIVPGFKFSRASYVLSLLRPQIINDLELKNFGLKLYFRDPNYFTPLKDGRYLLLGSDDEKNYEEISKFSKQDAKMLPKYEATLSRLVEAIGPLLDHPPVDVEALIKGSLREKVETLPSLRALMRTTRKLGKDLPLFYDLVTAPATKIILDKWFESEPLKACLAMDSIIGATISPSSPGSAYVLLHHVMGELDGRKSAWAYVEGGMGKLSQAIADSASSKGATIMTNQPVKSFLLDRSSDSVCGVVLEDGSEIQADIVLSNATPKVTFLDLLPKGVLSDELQMDISGFRYDSPVTKINVAVDRLPNFLARPNKKSGEPSAHHRCTIHYTDSMDKIEKAYSDCLQGRASDCPLIEMCIPSSLDPTLAPVGCHVISLFTQYTPYELKDATWTDERRNAYADKVFDGIEEFAPGFKSSVIGRDILTPPDLEETFGLTGGNIFHGVMSLDQLYFARPTHSLSNYRTPIKGLYLCGSGTHPGGGVMGASGRNAANVVIRDQRRK